jgi:hypothetical protein
MAARHDHPTAMRALTLITGAGLCPLVMKIARLAPQTLITRRSGATVLDGAISSPS